MLKRQKGQGLVEFALISPVLLLVILAIIEGALIFQGYLTVQHAARETARWAVTYQPDKGMKLDGAPCDGAECDPDESDEEYWDRRVGYIKQEAVSNSTGLRVDNDHLGLSGSAIDSFGSLPNYYGVEVWGFPSFEEPSGGWTEADLIDHPGLPGLPVRVRVTHNVELLDPLFRRLLETMNNSCGCVRVVAQAEMINEGTQAGYGNVAPPALPPPPPLPSPDWEIEITDTPVPEGWQSPTPEDTPDGSATPGPTLTPEPTETPTVTPSTSFIALSNYLVEPEDVILIDVVQHPATTYELLFLDQDKNVVDVISGTLVIDASGLREDIVYTIPVILDGDYVEGTYYVQTHNGAAQEAISNPLHVAPPAPDLIVNSIRSAGVVLPNEEITVTVEVENLSTGSASGFFDVDLYVDPEYPPATSRPGTSKQWLDGIGPFETKVVTHVVMLYGGGVHELWAQVDTSDWVPDELIETNNIYGPVSLTARPEECSEISDRFDPPDLDPKWSQTTWGVQTHNQTIVDVGGESMLNIEASGSRIGNVGSTSDSGTFLYQSVTGDFVATLRIDAVSGGGDNAQLGLMMRAGTSSNSAMAVVARTRNRGLRFRYRPSAGAGAARIHDNVSSPSHAWVRLVRMGDGVSAFYSGNGSSWAEVDGVNISGLPETVQIGISGAGYGGIVEGDLDDFEVCPIDGAAKSCQAHSDDFEADSTIVWSDKDFGSTVPGSSRKTGGVMIVEGNGSSLFGWNENFHYTYQEVNGDFVATLKINRWPSNSTWSKAGLMVRGSDDPFSALLMLMKTNNGHIQIGRRLNDNDAIERPDGLSDDDIRNVYGTVWVRLARSGSAFASYYSTDGTSWNFIRSTTANVGDPVQIGMAVSSYDSGQVGEGEFDDFLFCAGTGGDIPPPLEPPDQKPPGLKECSQAIELGNFEASSISPPWERSGDAVHASDRTHSGNFSLEFRASVGPRPEYRHLRPWAYQMINVPGDVMVETEGILSHWQYVVPDPPEEAPDADDHFYVVIRDSGGVTQTANIPLAHGDTNTPTFQQSVVNVETYLPGNRFQDLAGQQVQLFFYGVHDGVTPGTSFYMDDVRFDICTTQPIPEDVPDTASIGGLIEVLLNARPTKMPGIQVWAFSRGGDLFSTRTIHDSTYHFYNIPPGTYTIYAEVWTDGILYSGTTEVTVVSDERNYGVDMLLR